MFHWFSVSLGEIISRHGASSLLTFTSLNLEFDFLKNTSTLSEFIGYIFVNFARTFQGKRQIKLCRKIWIFNISFSWRTFTEHILSIFSYSNFRFEFLNNQSDYRKSSTHFCLFVSHPFKVLIKALVALTPTVRSLLQNKI